MNEQDMKGFEEWTKSQGFSFAELNGPLHELEGCWQACCEYKDNQYQALYDNARTAIKQEQNKYREQLIHKDAVIAKKNAALANVVCTIFSNRLESYKELVKMLKDDCEKARLIPNDDSALQEFIEQTKREASATQQTGD